MPAFIQKYQRHLFYSAWLLLSISQAIYTQLIDDEAYYWVYSKFLSWGYFDHPPMIAFLIKLGYTFFHNELGVRLFSVLLNALTVYLIDRLLVPGSRTAFYMIVLSIGMLQIGGILAVPDTPLLFFTALFFYCYRNYTERINLKNAIILALVTSLLFYSKYHGILVVIFTLLSNLSLLKKKETWIAGIFVLLFYLPHLLWQWENNWISFRYHLFESNVSTYRVSNTTDYILGQLLLAGPLTGLILLPAAFLYLPRTQLEKAFRFCLVGIYSVFFLSSFRGKVEVNWTMPVLVPLIGLAYAYMVQKISWLKFLRIISIASFFLIIMGRIYLVMDIGPDNAVKRRFHNNKEWSRAIAERTAQYPVAFYNSYQRASRFWFYSGKPSHSLNDYRERVNNYDFWPTDLVHLGDTVILADIYDMHHFKDSVKTGKGWIGWNLDPEFISLRKTEIKTNKSFYSLRGLNSVLVITGNCIMPRAYHYYLMEHPELKTNLWVGVFKGKEFVDQFATGVTAHELASKGAFEISIDLKNIAPGTYKLKFGLQAKDYFPVLVSSGINLKVSY